MRIILDLNLSDKQIISCIAAAIYNDYYTVNVIRGILDIQRIVTVAAQYGIKLKGT